MNINKSKIDIIPNKHKGDELWYLANVLVLITIGVPYWILAINLGLFLGLIYWIWS